jgi:hypothetical protein
MIPNRGMPEPTPEELAAWADGRLARADAERVEAWLAAHPGAASETESDCRLARLYRDHPPPEPLERAWQATLANIDAALAAPLQAPLPGARWPVRLLVGLVAAAVIGGVILASAFWPVSREEPGPAPVVVNHGPSELDEPFPVATVGEVHIISIDAADADRVAMGQPLLGSFELAAPEDIEIVKMEPGPEDGQMPRLHRGPEVPMIVVAVAGRQEP